MESLDLLPALIGGLIGVLGGAVFEWRRRRRRAPRAPAPASDAGGTLSPEARRRELSSLMTRVSRAMAAYAHMIDAGNLQDLKTLRRLFERLRAEESDDGALDIRLPDRRLIAAAETFAALHDEIDRKVSERIESGQPAAAAGEIRLRGPALASAIDELNAAAK